MEAPTQRGREAALAVADVVRKYTDGNLAAHDLRRTWTKLTHKGGARPDSIELGAWKHQDNGAIPRRGAGTA